MSFDKAVEHVLWEETGGDKSGAYHNDPKDPGGATKWGIAQRYHPRIDVKALTRQQAIDIYYIQYWLGQGCDKMPPALALLYFDCSVNPGEAWARKALQRALNAQGARLTLDGVVGPATLAAANVCDVIETAQALTLDRQLYYTTRPTFARFKGGWLARSIRTLTLAVTE